MNETRAVSSSHHRTEARFDVVVFAVFGVAAHTAPAEFAQKEFDLVRVSGGEKQREQSANDDDDEEDDAATRC